MVASTTMGAGKAEMLVQGDLQMACMCSSEGSPGHGGTTHPPFHPSSTWWEQR